MAESMDPDDFKKLKELLSDAEACARLVPAEATEGMAYAGNRMGDETMMTTRLTWAAMLDAGPYAPEGGNENGSRA